MYNHKRFRYWKKIYYFRKIFLLLYKIKSNDKII
jgi:hypothetical protein